MDNLGAIRFVILGLWLFLVQNVGIFASPVEALEAQQEAELDFKESHDSRFLGTDPIKMFETETPPREFLVGSLPFLHSVVIFRKKIKEFTSSDLFLRDHKYHLKTQVFPFHSYW